MRKETYRATVPKKKEFRKERLNMPMNTPSSGSLTEIISAFQYHKQLAQERINRSHNSTYRGLSSGNCS